MGGCDPAKPTPVGVTGKMHKNGWLCVRLFPIGTQTAGPNGLKFGMGAGINHGTICGWV